MGKLVVVLKVMPEDAETDLEALQGEIRKVTPESADLQGMEVKPLAFGLKSLHVTVVMQDEVEGGPDAVEDAYNNIDGVQSATVTDVARFD